MNNRISYITAVTAEFYKIKHALGFLLLFIIPIIFTLFFSGYMIFNLPDFTDTGSNMRLWIFSKYISFYGLVFPLSIAFFAYSYVHIEYASNGFKQLFTLPISRYKIYLAKITVLFSTTILYVLLVYTLLILSGNIMAQLFPQMGLQDYNIRAELMVAFARATMALISIVSIQWCLSLLYPNFIISLSFALIATIISSMASKNDYFLYNYVIKGFYGVFKGNLSFWDKTTLLSLVYFCIFFFLGFIIFRRKTH